MLPSLVDNGFYRKSVGFFVAYGSAYTRGYYLQKTWFSRSPGLQSIASSI